MTIRPPGSLYGQAPLVQAPGWGSYRASARQIIEFGRQLRDEDLPKYPLLPEAVHIAQQLASTREWRIITTKVNARGAGRAIDYLNNAICRNYWDGTIQKGFNEYRARRYLDYVTIGRTLAYWAEGEPLEYLDPAYCHFYINPRREWRYFNDIAYPENQVIVHHPIPKGGYGLFTSPLAPIIPTAMLAYLIREHDLASTDGRKLTDIMVTGSQQSVEMLKATIEEIFQSWDRPITEKNNVPIMFVDTYGQMPVRDLFHRLGLADIPSNFDREQFNWYYANEISSALGLAMRHFWSQDRSGNRAIEQINERRQTIKGYNVFVRTEQDLINNSGMLKQFGSSLRFEFDEEVDAETRLARAEVLNLFSEAVKNLMALGDGSMTMDMAISWGIKEGIIPSDIHELVGQEIQEASNIKSDNLQNLQPYECAFDQYGRIIEYRRPTYHITHVLSEMQPDENEKIGDWNDILVNARQSNANAFINLALENPKLYEQYGSLVDKIYNSYGSLTNEDHATIYGVLKVYQVI